MRDGGGAADSGLEAAPTSRCETVNMAPALELEPPNDGYDLGWLSPRLPADGAGGRPIVPTTGIRGRWRARGGERREDGAVRRDQEDAR